MRLLRLGGEWGVEDFEKGECSRRAGARSRTTFGKDEKRDLKRADVYPAIPLWQGAGAANRRHGLNIPSGSFGVRRGWLCKRHAYEGSVAQSL
ncbi:unnamed protein product [Rangifer tarandus platyrhynchus]|uniref:Uncharacterized protein n=1 Tax=Rangifer tarandus platyrhynchus TaxID=3082113 RepID=A0AC60A1U0_RANTA